MAMRGKTGSWEVVRDRGTWGLFSGALTLMSLGEDEALAIGEVDRLRRKNRGVEVRSLLVRAVCNIVDLDSDARQRSEL